ncbi:MAG: carboxypeptidase regulatory-like domain-containing protein [Thermoproteales archaeon]|nr:carboxypeptidase regulatory-like domain-containing protein [Thermoproteales archaeon]
MALSVPVSAQDPGAPREPGKPGGDKFFNKKKEQKPEDSRSVSGIVLDPRGDPVEGAVVQLKDTKTLKVRSFITLKDGGYRFHGLSTDTDYELRATHDQLASRTRRLSVYDSRKKAVINLKLRPKA